MNKTDLVVKAAIASLFTVGLIAVSGQAVAAKGTTEKCAGVIKAGKNDCATSKNQCHSHATTDADPEAWMSCLREPATKLPVPMSLRQPIPFQRSSRK